MIPTTALLPAPSGKISPPQRLVLGHPVQQRQPQHEAYTGLSQAHRHKVQTEGRPEGGTVLHGKPGNLRAHNDSVADHRRHRRQIAILQPGRPQRRQQGGQGAEHPVQHKGGTQQVCQEAPHCQAGNRLREKEGQHGHGLCHPELDSAVLRNGQQQGQRGIHSGNDTGCGHLTGRKTGLRHKKRPPVWRHTDSSKIRRKRSYAASIFLFRERRPYTRSRTNAPI